MGEATQATVHVVILEARVDRRVTRVAGDDAQRGTPSRQSRRQLCGHVDDHEAGDPGSGGDAREVGRRRAPGVDVGTEHRVVPLGELVVSGVARVDGREGGGGIRDDEGDRGSRVQLPRRREQRARVLGIPALECPDDEELVDVVGTRVEQLDRAGTDTRPQATCPRNLDPAFEGDAGIGDDDAHGGHTVPRR